MENLKKIRVKSCSTRDRIYKRWIGNEFYAISLSDGYYAVIGSGVIIKKDDCEIIT